jgi:hypothetical protein
VTYLNPTKSIFMGSGVDATRRGLSACANQYLCTICLTFDSHFFCTRTDGLEGGMKGSEQRLGSTEAQLSTVGGQVAACEAGLSDLGSQIALLSGNDEAKQALHDIQVYLGV